MSTPPDWTKLYQQNIAGGVSSDANSDAGISPGASGSNLSPEGRVSKPTRKRSRASRRTPTTLLNTDTTNFRAMVQQFTGGPTAPFPSVPPHPASGAASSFNFGRQVHHPQVSPQGGYRLQYQLPQQQQQNLQNQGYMISLSNANPGAGTGDGFFQRLGGSIRPPNTEVSDGFLMEMNAVTVPRPPASSSNENRGNGFIF